VKEVEYLKEEDKFIKTKMNFIAFVMKLNHHSFKQAKIYPSKLLADFKATLIKNGTQLLVMIKDNHEIRERE
jgi:hypothetical protein